MNLGQALLTPRELNLNKLGDAGGPKFMAPLCQILQVSSGLVHGPLAPGKTLWHQIQKKL